MLGGQGISHQVPLPHMAVSLAPGINLYINRDVFFAMAVAHLLSSGVSFA